MPTLGQVYDYLVHLLARGMQLATAIARAIARFLSFSETDLRDMASLAVRAFAAGSRFNMLPAGGYLGNLHAPLVPGREGAWNYTGYVHSLADEKSYFVVPFTHELSPGQLIQILKRLRDELGEDVDTVPAGAGEQRLYAETIGLGVEIERGVIVTRVERG